MQKTKLTTPFRKSRVLNNLESVSQTAFKHLNVQESQYKPDRQKTKKASITLENIIENKWSKSSREENKRCFHEGTLPTQGNHGEEAMDNIQGQDTEQAKRAHLCGKLYEKRIFHD